MTRRAPFASVWSDHNRAEHRAELLAFLARWAAFWGSVALVAAIAAIAIAHAISPGFHADLTWGATP